MTLIDFGDFKIRFDPKEVRISIDGEIVDVGARRATEDGTKFYNDDITQQWADNVMDIHDKLTGKTKSSRL